MHLTKIRNKLRECGLDSSGLGSDQWQALMTTIMNIQVLQREGNF